MIPTHVFTSTNKCLGCVNRTQFLIWRQQLLRASHHFLRSLLLRRVALNPMKHRVPAPRLRDEAAREIRSRRGGLVDPPLQHQQISADDEHRLLALPGAWVGFVSLQNGQFGSLGHCEKNLFLQVGLHECGLVDLSAETRRLDISSSEVTLTSSGVVSFGSTTGCSTTSFSESTDCPERRSLQGCSRSPDARSGTLETQGSSEPSTVGTWFSDLHLPIFPSVTKDGDSSSSIHGNSSFLRTEFPEFRHLVASSSLIVASHRVLNDCTLSIFSSTFKISLRSKRDSSVFLTLQHSQIILAACPPVRKRFRCCADSSCARTFS